MSCSGCSPLGTAASKNKGRLSNVKSLFSSVDLATSASTNVTNPNPRDDPEIYIIYIPYIIYIIIIIIINIETMTPVCIHAHAYYYYKNANVILCMH